MQDSKVVQTHPQRQQEPSVPETMSMVQHLDLQVIYAGRVILSCGPCSRCGLVWLVTPLLTFVRSAIGLSTVNRLTPKHREFIFDLFIVFSF